MASVQKSFASWFLKRLIESSVSPIYNCFLSLLIRIYKAGLFKSDEYSETNYLSALSITNNSVTWFSQLIMRDTKVLSGTNIWNTFAIFNAPFGCKDTLFPSYHNIIPKKNASREIKNTHHSSGLALNTKSINKMQPDECLMTHHILIRGLRSHYQFFWWVTSWVLLNPLDFVINDIDVALAARWIAKHNTFLDA